MIHAQNIIEPEGAAKAFDPPFKSGLGHRLPVVDRVPPELSSFAEVVWRHTRYHFGFSIAFKQELLMMRPDVSAIMSDVNRDVAHDPHPSNSAVAAQRVPLPVKHELAVLLVFDFVRQFLLVFRESRGIALDQFMIPGCPVVVPSKISFKRDKERVVFEPSVVIGPELLK